MQTPLRQMRLPKYLRHVKIKALHAVNLMLYFAVSFIKPLVLSLVEKVLLDLALVIS